MEIVMSMKPVLGAALHLLQYLSNAALVKASAYSSTLPEFKLALYKRSAIEKNKVWATNEGSCMYFYFKFILEDLDS